MQHNQLPLVIANWKMNFLKAQALDFINKLNEQDLSLCETVICPAFTILDLASSNLNKSVKIGAQDCSYQDADIGAFTGEISAYMLKDLNCEYVIIGHSERRNFNEEDNYKVKTKAANAHKKGIKAIICIGESLEAKEQGKIDQVLDEQLLNSLPASANSKNTIIAYEPIWAIGTGLIPRVEEINYAHQYIKKLLKKNLSNSSVSFENKFKVVYGGSVKSNNAGEILALDEVDGLLIGGASLIFEEFIAIIQTATKIYQSNQIRV
jgi:triosephosphate isomerase